MKKLPFLRELAVFIVLVSSARPLFAAEATAQPDAPVRVIVMPYRLLGDPGNAQIDSQHKQRLAMATAKLRQQLQQTGRFELVDEAASEEFSKKVIAALGNNDCDHCESALAKELNAGRIIAPWVYRLSQLVLSMHFDVIDVASGKLILKKTLDFRGDNDQSWQRAIKYFIDYTQKQKGA